MSLQQTLTVTRAPLTITANNQSKNYGTANPALTVSFSGFVNGDTQANLTTQPTAATVATTASRVGTYAITVSGAVSANYTFTYVSGTLTVNQVPLTITANSWSRNYGAAIVNLNATYTGFVNGDTPGNITQPTITTTATSSSPVGTYPITASGAVAPNYIITYVAGVYTINKVALTIRANNQSKIQGNPNPTLTVTYTGFVNGDTQASLTTPPVVTTTATTNSPVGSYPITASGAASVNYTISYIAGTLTVNPQAASLISVNNINVESLVAQNEPAVRQAVSPNGDGINDVLIIDNIENYPDNRVVLMNRSGNEIFNVTGYDNVIRVFDGHSNINKAMQLPGTYFYMLEYKVNGEVKRKTGYFIIKY
jgi:gliding motility-associated-like protein